MDGVQGRAARGLRCSPGLGDGLATAGAGQPHMEPARRAGQAHLRRAAPGEALWGGNDQVHCLPLALAAHVHHLLGSAAMTLHAASLSSASCSSARGGT